MKEAARNTFQSIEEYISSRPPAIRDRLSQIRRVVIEAAPQAEGRISYNMPAYFYNGRLVYFCAFKKHIGFYPASMSVFEAFRDELRDYKQSGRGTVQLPHDRVIPIALIKRIIEFRVKENEAKAGH